ncbi:alpha-ketoglutarate-dependent dioxygenase AlkB [Marivivens donghaensis]|uniref:Alpha-ketoglutarate-dependent dioxygenase AlkB n=1 Tax=Marivivens donghaensis TaxID=1699413 RepID=A0ABX0VW81_9RHOB|nr:alpha-ketoglutarate-dependent dioxygenase AlkB [Marivivens donghaensis]NIY71492.1 alpha-ketoglutarate-dependent dioxygenase AlkB [Marivivens donghaensis]
MKNSPEPTVVVRRIPVWKQLLSPEQQIAMVEDLRGVVKAAPLFSPVTPSGKEMSVRMTSAGKFGWVTDRRGYRYEPKHPSGAPWPEVPESVLDVWRTVSGYDRDPESCLVNFYGTDAKMGMHQDKDEADFNAPVVSISLGDAALFRIGNLERGGKTESIWLESGDVCVIGGEARLLYHGIDRIRPGSSSLLPNGGRINVTMRVVT